jgi:hypothetical protein
MDPLTGQRNGDPIADCFAAIAYQQGAILALADGVNWGERPKAAARGAVLGFCSSLHQQLAYAQGGWHGGLARPQAVSRHVGRCRCAQTLQGLQPVSSLHDGLLCCICLKAIATQSILQVTVVSTCCVQLQLVGQ